MSYFDPRSLVDKLVGACLSLMVCAIVLTVAVRLIEAIAVPLLIILGVAGALTLTIAFLVRRYRGW